MSFTFEINGWPEERWERLEPYVDISEEEIAALLVEVTGRDEFILAEVLVGGKCNTNLRIRRRRGADLVMRIYESDQRGCRRDKTITELIADSVPVAPFIGAVEDSSLGLPVAFFAWVEGNSPFEALAKSDAQQARSIAREIGSVLARVGAARRFDAHGLLDENLALRSRFESIQASFVEGMDWLLSQGRAGERLGPKLATQVGHFCEERAEMLRAIEGDYRLVHGDFKLSNLLVRPGETGWSVSAVLDWEFAAAGTPLMDLAILLRHEESWPEPLVNSIVEGFVESGGSLPGNWRQLIELLDLFNLCGFLNASAERGKTFDAVRQIIARRVNP